MNLGDYNSITLEATIEEDLPDDKKQSEHFAFMFEKAGKVLFAEFAKQGVTIE